MIQFNQEFSRVIGTIIQTPFTKGGMATGQVIFDETKESSNHDSLEIILTHGSVQGKKMSKKRYLLNGVGKRKKDFTSQLNTVLFQPQDIDLVIGSPSRRRHYFNEVLSQTDWKYAQAITTYSKAIIRRNKLLSSIREGEASENQLEFWDTMLIKHGSLIHKYREKYLKYLNSATNQSQFIKPLYQKNYISPDTQLFQFDYDHSVISAERLEKYHAAEIASATTLVGPHRDDIEIKYSPKLSSRTDAQQSDTGSPIHNKFRKLASYGSRGQQRLGVLTLKLGELEYLTQQTKQRPLLLLDDIFSELDNENDQLILELIQKQQTVITATEVDHIQKLGDAQVIKLKNKASSSSISTV